MIKRSTVGTRRTQNKLGRGPYASFKLGKEELRALATKLFVAAAISTIAWFLLETVLLALPEQWTLARFWLDKVATLAEIACCFGVPAWLICEVIAFGLSFRDKVIRRG